jgi:hypothetical protein
MERVFDLFVLISNLIFQAVIVVSLSQHNRTGTGPELHLQLDCSARQTPASTSPFLPPSYFSPGRILDILFSEQKDKGLFLYFICALCKTDSP